MHIGDCPGHPLGELPLQASGELLRIRRVVIWRHLIDGAGGRQSDVAGRRIETGLALREAVGQLCLRRCTVVLYGKLLLFERAVDAQQTLDRESVIEDAVPGA